MRFPIFLLAFILPVFAFGQTNEGEIIYEETVRLTLDLPDDMGEEMRSMMPTSQSFSRSLIFNEKASLYRDFTPDEDDEMEFEGEHGGAQIKMVMKAPENTMYTDLENGNSVNSREFFGRMFLISGELKERAWKLTGKQKKVLDYVCQQAIWEGEENTVEAWFTPQIPVSAGPAEFNGLPGLILEVSIDDGARTTIAQKVNLEPVRKGEIKEPTKGKAVSRKEFEKIEAEKLKEMEAEMGSGGGMIIIRN